MSLHLLLLQLILHSLSVAEENNEPPKKFNIGQFVTVVVEAVRHNKKKTKTELTRCHRELVI